MLSVDDLDVKIFRQLGSPGPPNWNLRESYSDIAKKLNVDEETVRLRVRRANESGLLPGWLTMINPRLVGCGISGLYLDIAQEKIKDDAIKQLQLMDGVTNIGDFIGRGLLLVLCYESDELLARKVQLIESICGVSNSTLWKSTFPKPEVKMRKIDWMIVNAMREDARRDLNEVANELGISRRTVQRRLAVMKEGKAIYLMGLPDLTTVGGVMCFFLVHCPDREKKKIADEIILTTLPRIGAFDATPHYYTTFGIACESLYGAEKILERIKAIDGVHSAFMQVIKELLIVKDWVMNEVTKRVSST